MQTNDVFCVVFVFDIACCIVCLFINKKHILVAVDLFCDTYDKEEVFAHSRSINSSVGAGNCWKIDDAPLDSDSLFTDSFEAEWDLAVANKVFFSLFILIATYLLLIGMYFGYNTCIDLFYHYCAVNSPNPRLLQNSTKLEKFEATWQRYRTTHNKNNHENESTDAKPRKVTESRTMTMTEVTMESNARNGLDENGVELTTLHQINESVGSSGRFDTSLHGSLDFWKSGHSSVKSWASAGRTDSLWVTYEGSLYNIVYKCCACRYWCQWFCLWCEDHCYCWQKCWRKLKRVYKKVDALTFEQLYPDSKLKIYINVWEDAFDTLIQAWTLAVYAGVQDVSFFGEYAIAVHPWYIKSFSIIIGSNSLLSSVCLCFVFFVWYLHTLQKVFLNCLQNRWITLDIVCSKA